MSGKELTGADVRAKLGHPIIDADGHIVESEFALLDVLKEVAGPDIAGRFEKSLKELALHRWYHADQATRQDVRMCRPSFWAVPANTLDRATAMLPNLLRERLDELGIDFMLAYTTYGLNFITFPETEMRRALCRAVNKLNWEVLKGHADRITPAAVIPTYTPQEALEEIDYAVKVLGMKAITVAGYQRRPLPKVAREAPQWAQYATYLDYLTLDSEYDYDPVWQKCVDLGVAPTSHVGMFGGSATHQSISNYSFNHAGHFAAGNDMVCRALYLGGVTTRFPKLKFGFLEGGAGFGSMIYNALIERFEKRNVRALRRTLDPALTDRNQMAAYFAKYGGERLGPKAELIRRSEGYMAQPPENEHTIDDFAKLGARTPTEAADLFVENFYFGAEGEDKLTALAFDRRFNHFGRQLKAMFGSDLGHWDVPVMAKVVTETYEMVEDGMITPEDFRKFTFANVAEMYTAMNPDFFKGTVVEKDCAAIGAKLA